MEELLANARLEEAEAEALDSEMEERMAAACGLTVEDVKALEGLVG